jgi:glycine oxidase
MRVLVLGAGIIGAAIADALARRGAEVVVLDMRSPGQGATQASAGVLAPFVEASDDDAMLGLCSRSLDLFDEFVADAAGRSRRAIDYRRCGTVQVALRDEDCRALDRELHKLGAMDVTAEWLDPAALREAEPAVTQHALGGLLIQRHAFVRGSQLLTAVVNAARFSGASFESPVEAAEVRPAAAGVQVRAGQKTYSADRVVIAVGSWSSRLRVTGAALPRVHPIRGQLLELGWPDAPSPERIVWGPGCYTVPWPDRTLLVGATVEDAGFDESATVEGVRVLTTAVQELLPPARHAAVRSVRVGLRPASADGRPIIGPLTFAPNVTMATGHYRNGILLAPITAAIVSRFLLDAEQDPAMAVTSPARFDAASKERSNETLAL